LEGNVSRGTKLIMESLSSCLVCGSTKSNPFIFAVDYTVSRETFQIVSCNGCGFKYTNPRPGITEIGKYYESKDYISHSNSTDGLINKLYQAVRKITLKRKVALINKYCQGAKTVLDIGCGTGDFLKSCKKDGWMVTGIEPNATARNQATTHFNLPVFDEVHLLNIETKFNVITLWHVLEHIHPLNERIEKLSQLLEPNGTLIIAVPNCDSEDARHYKQFWAAYDLPRHLYHFTPDSFKNLMKKHQLKVENMLGMPFDSFYVSLLSEKNQGKTMALAFAGIFGLLSNMRAIRNVQKFSSIIYIVKKDEK
jgi:2-polyprenyl-3-methyl-5-hydroxy-6-metoxy-1,4-benzoquinol methylase